MEIFDNLSALNASDQEVWNFLGSLWGARTQYGFVSCYGIYSPSSLDGTIGKINHVRFNGNELTLPFGETFVDYYLIWDGPWNDGSLHYGFVKFKLKLLKQEKRIEKGKAFLFTVDPFSIKNVYPETSTEEKENELRKYWGISNNLASGVCVQIKDKFFLEDIQSEFGIALTYPDTKDKIAPIPLPLKNPVLGNRYFFIWQSSPQTFNSEFEIRVNRKKAIIEESELRQNASSKSSVSNQSLYSRILSNWKTANRQFVGCYDYDTEKKLYCFTDIRSISFQELRYPNLERVNNYSAEEIFIPLDGPVEGMKLKSYYKIWWNLIEQDNERGYSFDWDKSLPFENIEPEGLLKLLKEIWENSDISVSGTMDETMKMVSSELMSSSDGTFIYELLQNANDYPVELSDNEFEPVDVEFHITDNFLVFRHSGDYFSPKDIAAICKLGAGTKKRKKNAIGYKGIGFKTVFNENEFVYVNTGDYSFRFDRKGVKSEYDPWQIMPISTGLSKVPEEVRTLIQDGTSKFRVQIAIKPSKSSILHLSTAINKEKSFEYLFRQIFQDIRDIVFIPNIRSVRVFIDGREIICRSKTEDSNWIVSKPYIQTIEPDDQVRMNQETKESGRSKGIPDRYIDFGDTTVLFACKKEGNLVKPVEKSTVNCYLPSQASFSFPFLMNTDMVPSGDRNELKTNVEFNSLFAKIAGAKFAEWLQDLVYSGYEPCSVFSLIPDFDRCCATNVKYATFIKAFETGFYETIPGLSLIPVRYEGNSVQTVKISDAIYDATRISGANVLTDEELLTYANIKNGILMYSSLRNCEPLRKVHDKFKRVSITVDSLKSLFYSEGFKDWLKVQENNNRWLDFLLGYSERRQFVSLPMFISGGNGELRGANQMFFNIDSYLHDLECFKDTIPFLSLETRSYINRSDDRFKAEELSRLFEWLQFNPNSYVTGALFHEHRKVDTLKRLAVQENSIRFIHFLATENIRIKLSDLPLFTTDGLVESGKRIIYFNSDNAVSYRSKAWLDSSWYGILLDDYLRNDKDSVESYLKDGGIKVFTAKSLLKEVILDASHLEAINEKISTSFEINYDFIVNFLAENKADLKDTAIDQFVISANNAANEQSYNTADDINLFFISHNLSEYQSKTWSEADWMFTLDERYKATQEFPELRTFFKEKFKVAALDPSSYFKKVVKKNLDGILKRISAPEDASQTDFVKESNLDFFKFLCSTALTVSEDESNPFKGKSFPFIDANGVLSGGPSSCQRFYIYSGDAKAVLEQSWIPEGFISVASQEYGDIHSIPARQTLLSKLGLLPFTYDDFISNVIICNFGNGDLQGVINQYENNIAFHKFFKENRKSFSESKLSALRNAPVCVGDEHKPMTVEGKELINDNLRKLINDPVVVLNTPIVQFIGEDYLDGTKADNFAYWVTCLGAREYSPERILSAIRQYVSDDDKQNKEKNIGIWRLVQSLEGTGKQELQKFFNSVPVLCKVAGQDDAQIGTVSSNEPCYISDKYFPEGGCIEGLLMDYCQGALIVSDEYLPDESVETKKVWFEFWERIGLLSSNKDLILNSVLPSLGQRKDDATPLLIYNNRLIIDEIREERIEELAKLNVKTRSGDYLPVTEVFFVANDLDEPMRYILLGNEISNEYSAEQCKYFRRIAEDADSVNVITDEDDWAELKIKQYLDNQTEDIHDQFISDMVAYYDDNSFMFSDIDFKRVLLKGKDNKLHVGSELTLGSAYAPEICDFEKCGVQGLSFISDHYLELELSKPKLRDFLSVKVGAHRNFQTSDIPFMADNYNFAVYIWTEYIRTKYGLDRIKGYVDDGEFDDYACVPNNTSVCVPEDIYCRDLLPFAKYIVGSEEAFPLDSIPTVIAFKDESQRDNPMYALDLNTKLTKDHCYEILLNSDPKSDKRSEVLARLVELSDEISNEEKEAFRTNPDVLWLNGIREVAPLSTLYGIGNENEDKYYRRHFQSDSRIIHEDTFGAVDYKDACDVLGLTILTHDDFRIVDPEGEDESANITGILKNKSILLATVIDNSENYTWDESFKGYKEAADSLKFIKCESLTIECKVEPSICSSDVIEYYFDKNNKTFYYVYGWQDKLLFDNLVKDLCRNDVMNIPDTDMDTIKRIIDVNLQGKRLLDFVKRYCQHFVSDSDFRAAFYECYPDIAVRLGWNTIEDHKEEEETVKEKVAYGYESSQDTEESETYDDKGYETTSEDSVYETEQENPEPEFPEPAVSVTSDNPKPQEPRTTRPAPQPEFTEEETPEDSPIEEVDDTDSIDVDFPEPGLYDDITDDPEELDAQAPRADSSRHSSTGKSSGSSSDKNTEVEDNTFEPREQKQPRSARTGNTSSRNWTEPKKIDSAWVSEGKDIKPISLGQSDFKEFEYEDVANLLHMDREAIADQNYLARKRFYDSMVEKGFQTTTSIEEFIQHEPGRDVPLKDGKYVHRCNAAKGILYISPSIWNKLKDDRCIICAYAGKKANEFIYFRSQQDLLAFVKDTAILIQVTGQDKGVIMDRMYSGSLQNKIGDLYAMIPVKPQGAADVMFTSSARDLDEATNDIDEI